MRKAAAAYINRVFAALNISISASESNSTKETPYYNEPAHCKMQSLQITAALILGCSALLFINASAFPFPWAEDALPLAETESILRHDSCCSPRIVTSPRAKKSSVIRSVPDYSGEVDIVADGGPSVPGMRPCDKEEYGFTYVHYSGTSEQRTLWERVFCPLFGDCSYLGGSIV